MVDASSPRSPEGIREMLIALIRYRLIEHGASLGQVVVQEALQQISMTADADPEAHYSADINYDSHIVQRVALKAAYLFTPQHRAEIAQIGGGNDIISQRVLIQSAIQKCKNEQPNMKNILKAMDVTAQMIVASARNRINVAVLLNTFNLFHRDCPHLAGWIENGGGWAHHLNLLDQDGD